MDSDGKTYITNKSMSDHESGRPVGYMTMAIDVTGFPNAVARQIIDAHNRTVDINNLSKHVSSRLICISESKLSDAIRVIQSIVLMMGYEDIVTSDRLDMKQIEKLFADHLIDRCRQCRSCETETIEIEDVRDAKNHHLQDCNG